MVALHKLFPRRSYRRQLGVGLGLLVLLWFGYLGLKSPLGKFVLTQGLTAPVPEDTGEPVDAIVILGRGGGFLMDSRTDVAVDLWEDQRAPFIFSSGRPEAENMMEQLHEKGVPLEALRGEDCSRTTEENALFTAAVLQQEGVETILLLTDSPHMLRSLLTFRSLGFEVVPHSTPFSKENHPTFPGRVISKEYRGILGYALLGRFLPRSFDGFNHLSEAERQKALTGGCNVALSQVASYKP